MSIDLLDPVLTQAWKRSRARRTAIRDHVARARHMAPEQVRLVQRKDGRVAVAVGVPRRQLELFEASKSAGSTDPIK